MAETRATTKAEPKPTPTLARASESSDPAVHQILAEIQTAVSNGNADAEAAARKRLADLGYE
jgi:hypothetical protein